MDDGARDPGEQSTPGARAGTAGLATPDPITQALNAWRQGDLGAGDDLIHWLYPRLRRLASRELGRDFKRPFAVTELVNESYVRLAHRIGDGGHWNDRGHFLSTVAILIRSVLLDHVRARGRQKRGGDRFRVELEDVALADDARIEVDLIALDQCLDRLEAIDPVATRLVELRYFAGLTLRECEEVLELGKTTLVRRWRFARAWLRRELRASSPTR